MSRTRTLFLLAAALFVLLAALALRQRHGSASVPLPAQVEAAAIPSANVEHGTEALDRTAAAVTRSELAPVVVWNPGAGPVQLAGRVVDEHGVPLAGASVTVAELGADKPDVVCCTTDVEGRFEAHGTWSSDEVLARAMHPDCWNSANCRVARGGPAVELKLQHGARLLGRFATQRLDPLPDLMLSVVNLETKSNSGAWLPFQSHPTDVANRGPGTIECTPDGQFSVHGLRPGHYSIEVKASGIARAVANVADIELRAGESWSGESCNPLQLQMPMPVEIEFEVAEMRALGRDEKLRAYFDPWNGSEPAVSDHWGLRGQRIRKDGNGVATFSFEVPPDLPGADLVPGVVSHVRLPAAGRFSVLLCLVRPDEEGNGEDLVPLVAISPEWIDVQDAVVQPCFVVRLDEAQLTPKRKQGER